MMIFKSDQREFGQDLQKAFDEVCKKHGMATCMLDVRRATDGSFLRVMKVDVMRASTTRTAVVAESDMPKGVSNATLARAMQKYGITKATNRNGDRLIDYKSSRPKYPFVFEGPRGGRWKASVEEMQRRFA